MPTDSQIGLNLSVRCSPVMVVVIFHSLKEDVPFSVTKVWEYQVHVSVTSTEGTVFQYLLNAVLCDLTHHEAKQASEYP
jgi:hypothetical protein